MEKGVWFKWPLFLSGLLALACMSCQSSLPPAPRPALPPPPAAAPQPTSQYPTFYVKVGRLNLRAGPGMDFPKIGLLERNEEVEKLGEAENWYQIRVKRDATLGWVTSEYLSSTPVTSPIETPVPDTPTAAPPRETPPAARETAPPAEPKKPKPARVDTELPRGPKPVEAAEPPPPKAKRAEEPIPAAPPEPRAQPEKPAPKKEAPSPVQPSPEAPEDKPSGSGIRIM
ncbi:MAG: SH3 domain-containing protein [Desulfobaccales bacterium]